LITTLRIAGFSLGGLVAGEGCFTVGPIGNRVDGSPRLRFGFQLEMAERDSPLISALQCFVGTGSIARRPPQRAGWLPTLKYTVGGRKGIRESVIPFCDEFLIVGAKQSQYLRWRDQFLEYEARFPSNWGAGPSPCAMPGCSKPVRGRGLCRAHYYRETGY
jgi:hypothetical protein